MFFTYTVIVSKDVTEARPGDEPFTGHQHVVTTDADGAELKRIVIRYKRFTRLLKALAYRRQWRRAAKADDRLFVGMRRGPFNAIAVGDLPVPAAVMAPPPSRVSD